MNKQYLVSLLILCMGNSYSMSQDEKALMKFSSKIHACKQDCFKETVDRVFEPLKFVSGFNNDDEQEKVKAVTAQTLALIQMIKKSATPPVLTVLQANHAKLEHAYSQLPEYRVQMFGKNSIALLEKISEEVASNA